jgi:hypothetical protein
MLQNSVLYKGLPKFLLLCSKKVKGCASAQPSFVEGVSLNDEVLKLHSMKLRLIL